MFYQLVALFFLTSLQLSAQVPYEQDFLSIDDKNVLKAILEQALEEQKLPSIIASATLGNKVIWARGVGYVDVKNKTTPKVQEHLYRWASVSKIATERLAQGLEEKGLLDQNLPISNYINVKEPSFFRRCFNDEQFQKFITCTKNYGGFGSVQIMQGFPQCFNPLTFSAKEASEDNSTYNVTVVDKSKSDGVVIYKNANGQSKCQASYKTNLAFVSSNKVTTNLLLSHKAGIIHYDFFDLSTSPPEANISNVNAIKSRKANGESQMEWAIEYFYPKHPLLFLPGAGTSYSTFGHNLAGVVMEKAAKMTYDKMLNSLAFKLGALSIQPDYLGLTPAGNYVRSSTYKLDGQSFSLYPYTTDNSFKLAGGGIMSNVVDLARFCVGINTPGLVTKNGIGSYSHSGSHPKRSESRLVLKTGGSGDAQCLVLMTNTQHNGVDLEAIRKKLEKKLIELKVWSPYRAD